MWPTIWTDFKLESRELSLGRGIDLVFKGKDFSELRVEDGNLAFYVTLPGTMEQLAKHIR